MLRRLNAHAVLEFLRASGAVTATEVMAATGLSRPTVHTVCDGLIELGWVTEVEARRTAGAGQPGRPNRCYEFSARAGYVLGVDLGAASIQVRLSDLRGDIVAEKAHLSGFTSISGRQRVQWARRTIKSVLRAADVAPSAVLAAAVGVASPVDSDGRVYGGEHYLSGLTGEDLRKLIGRGYSWPVLLENDANLAVLGERWHGVGEGVDNIVVLLAGERLGAGLFLGGQLLRGQMGGGGEMAFLRQVDCVGLPLVDTEGKTDGITRLARQLGREAVVLESHSLRTDTKTADVDSPTALFMLTGGDPERVDAEMVFSAARDGDSAAQQIVERIGDRIAKVIDILATLLDPAMIVLAGAFAPSTDVLLPVLKNRLTAYTDLNAYVREPPTVLVSVLGNHAVVLGATRLALDHVETETFERVTITAAGR